MCAGFNIQLATLNPVSPGVHGARWSIKTFMRCSPARHFFLRYFAFFPDAIYFAHALASLCSDRPHNQPQMKVKKDRGFFGPPGFVMSIRCPVQAWDDENTSLCAFPSNLRGKKSSFATKNFVASTCSSALHLSDSMRLGAAHSACNSVCARLGVKHFRGR